MKVHKFGGASIKDVSAIENVIDICVQDIQKGVLVFSAMGKTTNLLEQVAKAYFRGETYEAYWREFTNFNQFILEGLFDPGHICYVAIDHLHTALANKLTISPSLNFDFEYDQIVPYGEMVASTILYHALAKTEKVQFVDIRNVLRTDSTFREGLVDVALSTTQIQKTFSDLSEGFYITQGFIGADRNNLTTTLGREGSDYTAAFLGSVLQAPSVTVWKDVPGILCADPKWMPGCEVLHELSYHEAVELTYFGAKVIHPKTIKPLENAQIPLYVRSFVNPQLSGTRIAASEGNDLPPVYIRKDQQVLISILQNDFDFILETNLSHIFELFARHQVKVALMQHGAISLSVVADGDIGKVEALIKELKESYQIRYNTDLSLLTVRHYTENYKELLGVEEVLVEQKSRKTVRLLVRS